MVIQSKKVWLADQFVPAAIEVNDGRITAILPYGTKDVDDDYGDKRIVPRGQAKRKARTGAGGFH